MKVRPECLSCLFERAVFEANLVLDSDEAKIRFLKELLRYAAEHFSPEITPARIGTARERILKRISGSEDPYRELKSESNATALKLLELAERAYEQSGDKIRTLLLITAAGNSMEYGVRGHEFKITEFADEFERLLRAPLSGNVDEVIDAIRQASRILYLTDNAGEIVFDLFFIKKLLEMGKKVVISPKTSPILNDATVDDVRMLAPFDPEIVPSGSHIGLSLDEADEDILSILWDEEYLVISKGMGNYEMISEFEEKIKGRLIYILRAKCLPVAASLGVKQRELVAILR